MCVGDINHPLVSSLHHCSQLLTQASCYRSMGFVTTVTDHLSEVPYIGAAYSLACWIFTWLSRSLVCSCWSAWRRCRRWAGRPSCCPCWSHTAAWNCAPSCLWLCVAAGPVGDLGKWVGYQNVLQICNFHYAMSIYMWHKNYKSNQLSNNWAIALVVIASNWTSTDWPVHLYICVP